MYLIPRVRHIYSQGYFGGGVYSEGNFDVDGGGEVLNYICFSGGVFFDGKMKKKRKEIELSRFWNQKSSTSISFVVVVINWIYFVISKLTIVEKIYLNLKVLFCKIRLSKSHSREHIFSIGWKEIFTCTYRVQKLEHIHRVRSQCIRELVSTEQCVPDLRFSL